jgi:carnitine 3-dehydrogenase
MEKKGKVAIIGAGLIGLGWARRCLKSGYEVAIWDPKSDRENIEGALSLSSWTLHDSLGDAVEGAVFVQESAPERIELKHQLYADLAPWIGDDVVVASSTSTFMPSDLQKGVDIAGRLLVGHPFNPPDVLPLVEIVPGPATDPDAIAVASNFYASLGQRPIVLHRERPGHLANRLQAAVLREAFDAVASGQASVRDVDIAITSSLGPRWAIQGPFASIHLNGGVGGIAHYLDHLGPAFEALWRDATIPTVDSALRLKLIEAARTLISAENYEAAVTIRNQALLAVLSTAARFDFEDRDRAGEPPSSDRAAHDA